MWYSTNSSGYFYGALNDGFQLTGGTYPDPDMTWIFYSDADAKGQPTAFVERPHCRSRYGGEMDT